MSKLRTLIKETQSTLKTLGFDPKGIDGIWGNNSEKAFQAMYSDYRKKYIAWGLKFTPEELQALSDMMKKEGWSGGVDESDIMSCIAFETGNSFSPSIRNKISNATGLIQFMPSIARAYGTSIEALAKMSVIEQIHYIGIHFKPYAKRLRDITDVYSSILLPRGVGKSDDYVYWKSPSVAYTQNKGLDLNGDGTITKGEASFMIKHRYLMGMDPKVRRNR